MKRMHHKYGVLAILALGLIVALSLGAAPALAADGCDCHTVEPLTAPTPHAPYVAGVTACTTCHVGWTVPHPTALTPNLTAGLRRHEFFVEVTGGLSIPWVPLAGVTIYPQVKGPAATEWTTLEPLFGADRIATDGTGHWFRMVGGLTAWPPEDVTYRAVSQGVAGPPVVMPALSGPFKRPIPPLTLKLKGLTHRVLARGHAVTATGRGLPTELAGQKVIVRVWQRRFWYRSQSGVVHWGWHRKIGKTVKIKLAGDYSAKFTVRTRGVYRVRAIIEATAAYRIVRTDYRLFRVR